MKESARVHHSYGSYAPSTYGSYEPRRADSSTDSASHTIALPSNCRARSAPAGHALHTLLGALAGCGYHCRLQLVNAAALAMGG
jgi:hypothetical protein